MINDFGLHQFKACFVLAMVLSMPLAFLLNSGRGDMSGIKYRLTVWLETKKQICKFVVKVTY